MQLEVEPEEKFVTKNATAAVIHLQDWASPKKKLVSTVKTLLCPYNCIMINSLSNTIP